MLIQDNSTMPNAKNGYWFAGKIVSNVSGVFTIVFKTNKDIERFIVDFYSVDGSALNIATSYSFSGSNFTITGTVTDENPTVQASIKVDYLIFVSDTEFVNEEQYSGATLVSITEDLLNPKV